MRNMVNYIFGNKKEKEKSLLPVVKSSVNEFIHDTFLELTSHTYPHGYEDELILNMTRTGLFPKDMQSDAHGNYFYKIGESRTMFTSHLDTACRDSKRVSHRFDGDTIETDGQTILGADDKAGVTIMLYMIKKNVPGLYYFFVGEEVGCIGSGLAAKYITFKGSYDRCVSFDRRGTSSVITFQSSQRCCSDEFADNLAKELNKTGILSYKKDSGGIYTDSAEFTDYIPECTNLSVGYYQEHTTDESQDIAHLSKLAEVCLVIDWENLVTKRDPSKRETSYRSWNYGSGWNTGGSYKNYNSNKKTYNWRDRDRDYDYGSSSDYGSADFKSEDEKKFDSRAYGYGDYDDFYEEEGRDTYKKTRRGKGKKGDRTDVYDGIKTRSFYDDGNGNLIPMEEKIKNEDKYSFVKNRFANTTSIYEWVKFKFLDDNLTKEELETIKEQYFDMNDEEDRRMYETIRTHVIYDNGR